MTELQDADDAVELLLLNPGKAEQLIQEIVEAGIAGEVLQRMTACAAAALMFQNLKNKGDYAETVREVVRTMRQSRRSGQ